MSRHTLAELENMKNGSALELVMLVKPYNLRLRPRHRQVCFTGFENLPVYVEMTSSCFDLNVFLGLRGNLAVVLRKWHRKEYLPT